MATTFVDSDGNGQALRSFSFPSIKEADIKVDVDGTLYENRGITGSNSGATTFTINSYTTTGGGNVVFDTAPATSANKIRIFRDTDVDTAKATFTAGSSLKAGDLNLNNKQLLYAAQEEQNQTILSSDIKDGTIRTVDIGADQITNALIADNQIDSEHYVDGSIDRVHLEADIIDSTKLADNSVNSEHYVDGSIDHVHLANDIIDGDNIQDDVINSEHYAAGSIDLEHMSANSVDSAQLVNGSVDLIHMSANSVDSDQYVDGSIDRIHLEADIIDSTKLADNAVNAEHYVDGSIARVHLGNDIVDGTKIADDSIDSEHIAAGAVDLEHMSANSVDSNQYVDGSIDTIHIGNIQVTDTKLASNSVIESKITDLNVTTSKLADNAVSIGKLGCEQTTITNSDAHVPTSGAVVDYVAAQIAPIGGLEVVATDAAFPNVQPQAGVVISISDAGGVVFNGSGSSTTARTVGGSTVTINGAPSSLNNETLVAGVGLMVSSTGSSQIYNYHKILGKEDDIKQLSDDINDFNARYRVGSSNPTTALDSGDLFFNTGSGKLLVYNGTQSAWEEAQSIGQYFINTISSSSGTGGGSATFNGSAYRFTLSNAGAVAEQHIVSVNGVVQKPNSGTSQPSEGFAIDGADIIFSSAPPTGADFFIITIGSTVNIGTPSNGTVTTDKLASGAVTTLKLADDAVNAAKLASDAVVTASIVDGAVTSAKIADGTIVGADLASSCIDNAKLAANAVTSAKIADGTIVGADIASSAIDTAKIADQAVTLDKLPHGTGSNDGKFLRANNGADPTFESIPAGITINNQADNRVITATGTTDTLNSEANFTYDGTYLNYTANVNQTYPSATDSNYMASMANNNGIKYVFRGDGLYLGNGLTGSNQGGGPSNTNIHLNTNGTIEAQSATIQKSGAVHLLLGSTNGGGVKITLDGDSNGDGTASDSATIEHDTTGNLHIRTDNPASTCSMAFSTNGSIKAIFDGANGHFRPGANNTYNLGTNTYRWANVYTNDLHLSNEGHTNDIDGSWGNWTIQEGESDLFLKNNRSGKKYKFNLTEVV